MAKLGKDGLRDKLVEVARSGGFIYSQVAELIGIDVENPHFGALVGKVLGELSEDEVANGRPMLSSIVVSKDTHLPGTGFFGLGEQLRLTEPDEDEMAFAIRQIKATHAYWSNHSG